LVFPTHLHFEAVRILHVEASFRRADVQASLLQFRFDRWLDVLIRVPLANGFGVAITGRSPTPGVIPVIPVCRYSRY